MKKLLTILLIVVSALVSLGQSFNVDTLYLIDTNLVDKGFLSSIQAEEDTLWVNGKFYTMFDGGRFISQVGNNYLFNGYDPIDLIGGAWVGLGTFATSDHFELIGALNGVAYIMSRDSVDGYAGIASAEGSFALIADQAASIQAGNYVNITNTVSTISLLQTGLSITSTDTVSVSGVTTFGDNIVTGLTQAGVIRTPDAAPGNPASSIYLYGGQGDPDGGVFLGVTEDGIDQGGAYIGGIEENTETDSLAVIGNNRRLGYVSKASLAGDTSEWTINVNDLYPKSINYKVAIGTNTVASGATLDVRGDVYIDNYLMFRDEYDVYNAFLILGGAGEPVGLIIGDGDGNQFAEMDSTGQVGIGIAPTAGNVLTLGGNLRIYDDGYVGIGVDPAYPLDITGDINLQDGYVIRENTVQVLAFPLTGNTVVGSDAASFSHVSSTQGYYNTILGYEAGDAVTTGFWNEIIGYNAGGALTTGYKNTIIGTEAGNAMNASSNVIIGWNSGVAVSSDMNTIVGVQAMEDATSAQNNVAIGYYAAGNLTTGDQNICIGQSAGSGLIGGEQNIIIGAESAPSLTESDQNVIIGYGAAGSLVNSGSGCIMIGKDAGDAHTTNGTVSIGYEANKTGTGQNTVAIGTTAGYQSGQYMVSIGHQANRYNSGANSVAVGYNAGYGTGGSMVDDAYTVFIGYCAGQNHDGDSDYSIAIGNNCAAGTTKPLGQYCTYIGTNAAQYNSGDYNTAMGYTAMQYVENNYNVAIGYGSMKGSSTGSKSANKNTAIGYNSLNSILGGTKNVAVGYYALYADTSGYDNVAVGEEALRYLTSGYGNTSLGFKAGYNTTTGYWNVHVGDIAGEGTTTGSDNTCVGMSAGRYNQTGTNNVAIGRATGESTSGNSFSGTTYVGAFAGQVNTGNYNCGIGGYTLSQLTSGTNNTAIGYQAGYSCVTGSGNVFIGFQAGYSETGSNTLYIDNTSTTTPLIKGDFSANRVTINTILNIAPQSSAPGSPSEGDVYYDSDDHKLYCWDGSNWQALF